MASYGNRVRAGTEVTAAHVAGAFSSAVFRDLATAAPGLSTRKRLAMIARAAPSPESSLGEAFEQAHRLLIRDYRNEYVFKNSLVTKIVFGKHSPRTASALIELGMGNSWADVVIVNGTTTTYEIKTDLDQFSRLATQIGDYTSRSEFVNVVTSDRRAASAELTIPKHVGIVTLRRSGTLVTIRESQSNLPRMSSVHLFSVLRTKEALGILHDCTGYELDVPPGEVWKRTRDLFAELPLRDAHAGVISHLRARGRTAAELATDKTFPPSLRALAYATELSTVGRSRLKDRLASPAALVLEG